MRFLLILQLRHIMRIPNIEFKKLSSVLPFEEVYRMLNQLAYAEYYLKHIRILTDKELVDLESKKELEKNDELREDFLNLYRAYLYIRDKKIEGEIANEITSKHGDFDSAPIYLTEEYEEIGRKIAENPFSKNTFKFAQYENRLSLSDPWFIAQIEAFSKEDKKDDEFIKFLLEASQEFLPSNYAPMVSLTATDIRFPSSTQKYDSTDLYGHSLYIGKTRVIAVDAPKKMSGALSESTCLESFIKMLSTVDAVFPLGNSDTRADYRNVQGTNFSTELLEEDDTRKLKIIPKENSDDTICSPKEIIYFSIGVGDQKSLNLTDKQLDFLSEFFNSGKSYAVHCDSGVGRTGQFIFLHQLWSLYFSEQNYLFKMNINSILHLISQNKSESPNVLDQFAFATFYDTAFKALARLRKIRYFVETQNQFNTTLPLLLMLINPKLRNEIRNKFDLSLPDTTLDGAVDVDTATGTTTQSIRSEMSSARTTQTLQPEEIHSERQVVSPSSSNASTPEQRSLSLPSLLRRQTACGSAAFSFGRSPTTTNRPLPENDDVSSSDSRPSSGNSTA
jgi:hypothetical protein